MKKDKSNFKTVEKTVKRGFAGDSLFYSFENMLNHPLKQI